LGIVEKSIADATAEITMPEHDTAAEWTNTIRVEEVPTASAPKT